MITFQKTYYLINKKNKKTRLLQFGTHNALYRWYRFIVTMREDNMDFTVEMNDKFVQEYNKNYSFIFNKVLSKVGNAHDAEEISQEVFITYYNNFDKVYSHRQWLLKASYFEYLKFCKENNIQYQYQNIEEDNDLAQTIVDSSSSDLDTQLVINDAIENKTNYTNSQDKTIFDMVARCKFTYLKTAKILGLSERQVRYKYQKILFLFLTYFKTIGINQIEDLL